MKSLIIVLVVLVFCSCKTNLVYINATNPAPVTVSKNSKNIGIVNRAIPDEKNKDLNTVHQTTTGQTLQLIKDASGECIRGLKDALLQNQRFDTIKTLSQVQLRTPVAGTFPSQLSWSEVSKICAENKVDLLFSLEIFDSQIKIVPLAIPPKINNPTDILNAAVGTQANITTTVKTGWRIYDPNNNYIIDEYPLTDNLTVTASVLNVINTVEAMMGRKEAIKQSSNKLGSLYADRLLPYYIKVTRDYYVKGTYNFKIATRKARTGNWDGAGELWLKETTSTRRKIAGRAHYNMAILNEINGNLDVAIQYAQKAYENYNNKLALHYVNALKHRKQSDRRLQAQQQ